MSAFLRLRIWVDRNLAEGISYKLVVGIAFLPAILTPIIGRWWLFPSVGFAVVWVMFVGWRSYRLTRATAYRGDRSYDRGWKHKIPPEYSTTESATAARRRKNG